MLLFKANPSAWELAPACSPLSPYYQIFPLFWTIPEKSNLSLFLPSLNKPNEKSSRSHWACQLPTRLERKSPAATVSLLSLFSKSSIFSLSPQFLFTKIAHVSKSRVPHVAQSNGQSSFLIFLEPEAVFATAMTLLLLTLFSWCFLDTMLPWVSSYPIRCLFSVSFVSSPSSPQALNIKFPPKAKPVTRTCLHVDIFIK